ncbi:MAG: hypothetical protein ACQESE_00405 [Nanobdellota archaeon]
MVRRKPIPAWIFFFIGILISGYSWFVKNRTETANAEAMQLFIYIGLGFIAIGVLKLLFLYIKKAISPKEKKLAERLGGVDEIDKDEAALREEKRQRLLEKRKKQSQTASRAQGSANNHGSPQNTAQSTPRIILCPQCQTKNYNTSNYCHMCGYQLK